MGLSAAEYLVQLQALLPLGAAWPREPDAILTQLLAALAEELARVDRRATALVDEADARTTYELLCDWERVAGLPDPCSASRTLPLGPGLHGVDDAQIASFARATTATYADDGVVKTAAIDEPRYEGGRLLIEEERTNALRNNTMQGAIAGFPGTLPTYWSQSLQAGVSREVVGTGTEDGVDYIDVRFNGTPSATGGCFLYFGTTTGIGVNPSEVLIHSAYVKLAGGSFANVVITSGSTGLALSPRDASATSIAGQALTNIVPSSVLQRFAATLTAPASAAYVQPLFRFGVTSGQAIDFTLRIGLPQVERGADATSVIKTSGSAVTRAADLCEIYETLTAPERRGAVATKLRATGGQSRQYFVELAAALGYSVTIVEHHVRRHGLRHAGEPYSRNPFVWQVCASGAVRRRRYGRSIYGERYSVGSTKALECLFNRLKPAHTDIIFTYGA